MNVELRPARDEELPAYLERLVEEYAADMVANAGLDFSVARQKSEADNAGLFPGGRPGPGITVFVVEADGEPVGNAILGERERFGSRFAHVYDIVVDEAWRGRGIGRRAMELLEEEALARGYDRIELNVFGGNTVARSLYRSLGYNDLAVAMAKDLG